MSRRIDSSGLTGYTVPGAQIVVSVNSPSAGDLTITVKTSAGNIPSQTEPLFTASRVSSASGAQYEGRYITSELSLTVASGNKIGFEDSQRGRLWVLLFDDGGTFRLAVTCRFTGAIIYPLVDHGIESAISETQTGAGAMDFAGEIYSSQAIDSKSYRILGYLDFLLSTAGVWDTAPAAIQMFHAAVPLPGREIRRFSDSGASAITGTTTVPYDDTLPQSGEGVQLSSITNSAPLSPNAVRTCAVIDCTYSVAARIILSLFSDKSSSAWRSTMGDVPSADAPVQLRLEHLQRRDLNGSEAFSWRAGGDTAGTIIVNGNHSGRILGGALQTEFYVAEIMV